jgi:hypothetical protein
MTRSTRLCTPLMLSRCAILYSFDDARSCVDRHVDTNADSQPDTLRSLQWDDTGRLPNSHGGGNPQFMERHVQRGRWSRFVHIGWLEGRGADIFQDLHMLSILLHMKLSSTLWEEIKQVCTIHLPLVSFCKFPGPY